MRIYFEKESTVGDFFQVSSEGLAVWIEDEIARTARED